MAITTFPLTVNLPDLVGEPVKRAFITIRTNLPVGTPIAYTGGEVVTPGGKYPVPGGNRTFDLPTKTNATNVSNWQYIFEVEVELFGRSRNRTLDPVYVDAPSATTAKKLTDFIGVTSVPPTFIGALVEELKAYRDEAYQLVVTDLETSDGQVSALINAGPEVSDTAAAVHGIVAGQIADANPAIAQAAADYAASGVGVLTAGAAPTLAENRALDPQAKTTGGSNGPSVYELTRITTSLPSGVAYGLETVRAGTLNSTISSMYLGAAGGSNPLRWPVTPGEKVSASAGVWTDQSGAQACVDLAFITSSGTAVSTSSGTFSAIAASTWERRKNENVTVPATAAYVIANVVVATIGGANTVTGAKARATAGQLVTGATVPATYGDGSFPGWVWTGVPHESSSRKVMATAADFAAVSGGTSDADLIAWATAEAFVPSGSIVRNGDGVMTSAAIKWPDGATGTFTATDTTGGYLNAYTATHVTSGKKVTQSAVTRNAFGDVTAVPAPTVGAI